MLLSLKIKRGVNVIDGLCKKQFNPSNPFVGIKKPSGGIVYFNLLGTRIQPTIKTMNSEELLEHTEAYGRVFIISSGQDDLLEHAVAGEIIPWKGLQLQRYSKGESFWYVVNTEGQL